MTKRKQGAAQQAIAAGSNGSSAPILHKRFRCPAGCSIHEFVMRELTSKDELDAAMWADKLKSIVNDESPSSIILGEQREAMRLSLVTVDGQRVNDDGLPFLGMDTWTVRTVRFVQRAFQDMNGVTAEELENFTGEAEIVHPSEMTPHDTAAHSAV